MSGGRFSYDQNKISYIADAIECEIRRSEDGFECWSAQEDYKVPYGSEDSDLVYTSWKNSKKYRVPKKNIINNTAFFYGENDEGVPLFDKPDGWNCYPSEILDIFKDAVRKLKDAAVYAQRIDWFLSGDDGEESLIRRLKEDLEQVKQEVKELEDNNWYIGAEGTDKENWYT